MKTYKQFLNEISPKLIGSFLGKAGEAIRTMAASPEKSRFISKIVKRSKGIAAAKKRPLPFYIPDNLRELTNKELYLYNHYKDKITEWIKSDRSFSRYSTKEHQTPEAALVLMRFNKAIHGDSADELTHKYQEFMARTYANKEWRMEDLTSVKNDLAKFDSLKPQLKNKDVNSYKSLSDLRDATDELTVKPSKNETLALAKIAGTTVIVNEPEFKLLKLKNMGAVRQYCSGTRWCFSDDYETFKSYSKEGGIHIILAKLGGRVRKFAFHRGSDQFMNEKDNPITKAELLTLTKFPGFEKVKKLAWGNNPFGWLSEASARRIPISAEDKKDIIKYIKVTGEKLNRSSLDDALYSIVNGDVIVGRWPEIEPILAGRGTIDIIVDYVEKYVKGRLPAFEERISKPGIYVGDYEFKYILDYVNKFSKTKMPLVEKVFRRIEKDGEVSGDVPLTILEKFVIYTLTVAKERNRVLERAFERLDYHENLRPVISSRINTFTKNMASYYKKYVPREEWSRRTQHYIKKHTT
jgi:hypothetical protein